MIGHSYWLLILRPFQSVTGLPVPPTNRPFLKSVGFRLLFLSPSLKDYPALKWKEHGLKHQKTFSTQPGNTRCLIVVWRCVRQIEIYLGIFRARTLLSIGVVALRLLQTKSLNAARYIYEWAWRILALMTLATFGHSRSNIQCLKLGREAARQTTEVGSKKGNRVQVKNIMISGT